MLSHCICICRRIDSGFGSLLTCQHPCPHQKIIQEPCFQTVHSVKLDAKIGVSYRQIRALVLESGTALDIYPLGSALLLSGCSDGFKLAEVKDPTLPAPASPAGLHAVGTCVQPSALCEVSKQLQEEDWGRACWFHDSLHGETSISPHC